MPKASLMYAKILDLSSATANAAVVVTKGAWQYI